jgi:uncharacterized protein (DUF433 family)
MLLKSCGNTSRGNDDKISLHLGKPCVAGTRIPVEEVLGLIQEGVLFQEIVEKYYPDLEIEDVKACAWYAAEMVRAEEVHVRVP